MWKRLAWLLIAASTLSACASTGYRSAYAFRCGAKGFYGLGTLTVARWIGHNRKLVATVLRWEPHMPKESRTYMEVQWAARVPKQINLGRGVLTITHRLDPGRSFQDPAPSSIELSATPAGGDRKPPLRGWINHQKSSEAIQLSANWSLVRALAHGHDDLFLLVRDATGEIIETISLRAALFYEAPRLEEILVETQYMPSFPELLLGKGCEEDSSPSLF